MRINQKHEIILNYNFMSINIRIYITPNISQADPDGVANTMRQIDIALQPYTQNTNVHAEMIPSIVDSLSMVKAIKKIEIINPTNLNGFCVYPND